MTTGLAIESADMAIRLRICADCDALLKVVEYRSELLYRPLCRLCYLLEKQRTPRETEVQVLERMFER